MRDEIACEAIAVWGETAQTDMLVEECAELIQAIQHWKRGRASTGQVASEIADVSIMLAQARFMFGVEAVDAARSEKVTRLVSRLDDAARKRHGRLGARSTAEQPGTPEGVNQANPQRKPNDPE